MCDKHGPYFRPGNGFPRVWFLFKASHMLVFSDAQLKQILQPTVREEHVPMCEEAAWGPFWHISIRVSLSMAPEAQSTSR